MAQGRDTISQRISIEGAEDVIRQLRGMGAAGEEAILAIRNAVDSSTGTTSRIGALTDSIRSNFSALREHLEPVKQKLGELRDSVHSFNEKLKETGDRIIPHFKEAAALAFAGSVAGIIALVKETANYTQELKKTSEELGVSIEQYQELQFTIRSLGLEQDRFISTFTRLARSMGEAIIQNREHIRGLANDLVGVIPANNTVLGDPKRIAEEFEKHVRLAVDTATPGLKAAIEKMRNITLEAFKQSGQDARQVPPFVTYMQQALKLIQEVTPEAAKFRTELYRFTGVSVPIRSIGEAFARVKEAGTEMDVLFNRLGVSFQDVNGHARPLIDVFHSAAVALNAIPNPAERAFNAQLIFSRGFKEILPAFADGGIKIRELREEWEKMNIALSDAEIEAGSKLFEAFARLGVTLENLKSSLILVFSPDIIDLMDGFREGITETAHGVLEWARAVRQDLQPGLTEIYLILRGQMTGQQAQVQWVRTLVTALTFLRDMAVEVAAGFKLLISAMDEVAVVINSVFGTQFTGSQLTAALAVMHLFGIFGLLRNAIFLVGAAIGAADAILSVFLVKPIVGLIELAARFGLVQAAVSTLGVAWTTFGELFGIGRIAAMFAPLLAFLGPVGIVAVAIIAIGSAIFTLTGSWDKFFNFVGEGVKNLVNTFGAFIELIVSATKALGRFLGATAGQTPDAAGPIIGQSGGGPVPGSGSGDHVPILGEPGEFMVQKSVAQQPGMMSFLHALNSGVVRGFSLGGIIGRLASVNPAPLRMASGGLVPTRGDPGRGLTLVIGDRTFRGLTAPAKVHDDLVQFARSSSLVSTGKKPSWAGSG